MQTASDSSSVPTTHRGVELPRNVCGAEDEDPVVRVPDALHLHEELVLYPPRRVTLAFRAARAQRVDLVNEDDRRSPLARHFKQVLHESARTRHHTYTHTRASVTKRAASSSDRVPTSPGGQSHARTHFSLSPCHLDTRLDDDTAKNVESASVATAFARYDLPVPGGCSQRSESVPCQWLLFYSQSPPPMMCGEPSMQTAHPVKQDPLPRPTLPRKQLREARW